MNKLFIGLLIIGLVMSVFAEGDWDEHRHFTRDNRREFITEVWTFQDSTFFNGVLTANIVVIDTIFVNYIDADTIIIDNFIRPKTNQCADNGQANYRWNYIYGDTINSNELIINTESLPDADQGANLGKDSFSWNITYSDSVLNNYNLIPLNGKLIFGDGSTYLILSDDDVLDLYINSALAGRFSATSFTWGLETNLGDAITDTVTIIPVVWFKGGVTTATTPVASSYITIDSTAFTVDLDLSRSDDFSNTKYWIYESSSCFDRRDGVRRGSYLAMTSGLYSSDDAIYFFGNGIGTIIANTGTMLWETADANANCILMTMPEGGTVDVPVFVIGDSTCFNKDLGWFNGSTQPNIALIDDDADSWAMFGHSTDDNPYIQYGGQANAFGVKGDFIIDSTLTLKGQVNPNTAQLVSFGTAVLPFNLYYGDSLDVNYADVGDLATANTIGGAYIYRVGGTDIAFSDGGLGFSTALQGDLLYWSNYDTPAKLGWTSTASYLKSGADSSISWDALTSDDLGDLASIAMLDEDETITGNWVNTTNPWAYNEGGTGTGTYLQGDILYASDYNALSRLGWSLEGKLLTQLADSGIGYTTATYPATILQGDILIASNFSTISNYPWPGIGYYLVSGADSSWTTNPLLKDLTVSGTGMSGGADDILLGADADVTITLTTSKDAVAGDGLGGGEDNVFPGADADVTFAVLLDTDGGLETTDDSVNIKLDGTTLTVSSSGLKVTDNTFQPLEAILTDIADGTILENLVNTANPWADNEIASSATWNARLDSAIIVVWGDTNSHIATYTYVVNNATQDGDTASWLATKTWVPANSQADGDTSTWDATKTDLIEKISSTALDTKSEFNTQCGDGDFVFGGDSPSLAIVTITGALKHSVTAGITAVNPGAQGDGTLTTEVNEVATVANASDAVTLPAATPGLEIFIINNGANILEIWPGTDDNLGAGVNNATTLASGFNITFVAYDATNWEVK